MTDGADDGSLSDASRRVLRAIVEYRDERGCSPTIREIAGALGIAPSTVSGHVNRLARRGLLTIEPRRPRGVDVTEGRRG